jgi:hypothetical protein
MSRAPDGEGAIVFADPDGLVDVDPCVFIRALACTHHSLNLRLGSQIVARTHLHP